MDPSVCLTMDSELNAIERAVVEDITNSLRKIERLLALRHRHANSLIHSKLIIITYLVQSYSLANKTGLVNVCNRYIDLYNARFGNHLPNIQCVPTPAPKLLRCFGL